MGKTVRPERWPLDADDDLEDLARSVEARLATKGLTWPPQAASKIAREWEHHRNKRNSED